jgi:TolB-like protein/DNA-binding winged helix-turn-helix (wHTH) protein/Flp pilus assembly protein TadD
LHKNGHRIRLPEQPFQILAMLLERAGDVVTREELQKKLWPADTFVDFDHGLNNAIKKLRDVLDDSAERPRFIETLPKRGYRFIHPLESDALAGRATAPVPVELPSPAVTRRPPWVAALLVCLLAVPAVLVVLNVAGVRDRLFGAGPSVPIRSIAVLPLENLSGDPAQEYLVDGIHDEIITQLAGISSLSVPSRTTVMRYKKQNKTMADIARELGVDAVVEGTVKRTGNRVRITVQLIHAPTDRHLAAKAYDRDWNEMVVLPGEVARAIIGELRVQLTPQELARLDRSQSVHPDAYEAYLIGRHYFNRDTRDSRIQAKEQFEKAISIDPAYARAYAGLALVYVRGGAPIATNSKGGYPVAPPKARELAGKALELDETLAEAHTALAFAHMWEWNWPEAEREFKRAIELNPNYAVARIWYAWYLEAMLRPAEMLEQVKLAMRLEPESAFINFRAGYLYLGAGQLDEARARWRKVAELEPDAINTHTALAQAYIIEGRHAEAIAQLEDKVRAGENGPFAVGTLACAYGHVGRRTEALKLANDLKRRRSQGENVMPEALIYASIGLGDSDQAFAWLEKSFEERRWLFTWSGGPMNAPLRSDPRFADLLHRAGLPIPRAAQPASASRAARGRATN